MTFKENAQIQVVEASLTITLMDRHVEVEDILIDSEDIDRVEEALEVLRQLEREAENQNIVKYI